MCVRRVAHTRAVRARAGYAALRAVQPTHICVWLSPMLLHDGPLPCTCTPTDADDDDDALLVSLYSIMLAVVVLA